MYIRMCKGSTITQYHVPPPVNFYSSRSQEGGRGFDGTLQDMYTRLLAEFDVACMYQGDNHITHVHVDGAVINLAPQITIYTFNTGLVVFP